MYKSIMIIVRVIDWNFLLWTVQGIFSINIELENISTKHFPELFLESVQRCLFVWCALPKSRKKSITNTFSWSICNDFHSFIKACVSDWSELGLINC